MTIYKAILIQNSKHFFFKINDVIAYAYTKNWKGLTQDKTVYTHYTTGLLHDI